jgi:ribosome-associated translation inhibitor RaiA
MTNDELDFTLELNSSGLSDEVEDTLFVEADNRLRSLAKGHSDIVGAAVTLKEPAHDVGPPTFEATVVTYVRPSNIAATEKADNPMPALKGALNAVERQVREKRKRLKEHWERPGNDPVSRELEAADEEVG